MSSDSSAALAASAAAASSVATPAAAPATAAPPFSPLLFVVLGCTGTGKTNLSLALAKRYNAEVISTDSMQLYAGLPVASNQLTVAEAQGVRHHMLSVLPPTRAMHVRQFRRAALRLLDDLAARGKNAVLVGGTFYYVESVLFSNVTALEDGQGVVEDVAEATAAHGAAAANTGEAADTEMNEANSAAVAEDMTWPADAPLSQAALSALDAASVVQLTPEQLAFACSMLLSRKQPRATAAMALALLRHLSQALNATQFQQLLARMPLADVRNVNLVAAVRDPPPPLDSSSSSTAAPSAGLSSSTSSSSSSTASSPSSVTFPSQHLYELLVFVDARSAAKLHPNDGRKLRRALTVFVEQKGQRTLSELIAAMNAGQATADSHSSGASLPPAVPSRRSVQAVWLDCAPEVLERRLDARVDTMLARGLVAEAEALYKQLWTRQQQQASSSSNSEEPPFRYENPLDIGCTICATVESNIVDTPAATLARGAGSAASASSSEPAPAGGPSTASGSNVLLPPDYLGPPSTALRLDWERGIGQTLGFKEFRPYFTLKLHTELEAVKPQRQRSCSPDGDADGGATTVAAKNSPPSKRRKTSAAGVDADPLAAAMANRAMALQSCLATCVASLKTKTRAYARVQHRWIAKRLWPASLAAMRSASSDGNKAAADDVSGALSILRLDAAHAEDPAAWEASVLAPTMQLCDSFVRGDDDESQRDLKRFEHLAKNLPPLPVAQGSVPGFITAAAASSNSSDASAGAAAAAAPEWTKRHCAACDATTNGPLEWERHVQSRFHRSGGVVERMRIKLRQIERQAEVAAERKAKKEAAAAAAAAAAASATESDGAVTKSESS